MKYPLFALIPLAGFIMAPQDASADPFRCADMPYVPATAAPDNNQWGLDCNVFNYLGDAKQPFIDGLNSAQQFVVYAVDANIVKAPLYLWPLVPTKPIAAQNCIAGARFLTVCPAGCYAPDEQLQFDSTYMSIESAYKSSVPTITSLTADSTTAMMSYAEQPIQSYIVGETQEDLYSLAADNGKRLRVTANHPLVNGEGVVVPASSIQVGDELLCSDGSIASVMSIEKQPYSGWVMSVLPASDNKQENVHVANGFLAGSVRFQAQWASDKTRLLHRDLFEL
jgi:hypothetical protein